MRVDLLTIAILRGVQFDHAGSAEESWDEALLWDMR